MSSLIAVIFTDVAQAESARSSLRSLQKAGQLDLQDAAVVSKDADGKMHVHNEVDKDVWIGAGIGGVLGLLLATFLFPLAGLVIGVAGGALVGKMFDRGLDKKFVKEVEGALTPGTSALLFVADEGSAAGIRAALEPYQGTLYQTNLDPDFEQQLKDALK